MGDQLLEAAVIVLGIPAIITIALAIITAVIILFSQRNRHAGLPCYPDGSVNYGRICRKLSKALASEEFGEPPIEILDENGVPLGRSWS